MTQSIQDLLTLAREQLQHGNLAESEESFRRVVTSGQFVAQGLYGIGMVRSRLNDPAGARNYLLQSLQQDPSYADTHYQLGLIAQQQQSWEEAQGYFRKAVAIDPQHQQARQALSQQQGGLVQAGLPAYPSYTTQPAFNGANLSAGAGNDPHNMPTIAVPPVSQSAFNDQSSYQGNPYVPSASNNNPYMMPTVATPPASQPTPGDSNQNYGGYRGMEQVMSSGGDQSSNNYTAPQRYGAYDFLRDDPSRRAQNTLAVIDALRIKGHPSVSAYLGSFMPSIFGLILIIAFSIAFSLLTSGATSGFAGISIVVVLGLVALWGLFALLNGLVRYLRIVSTEYRIDQGRFQITKGIFGKTTVTYELLRVHNIEFKQSFSNRLTGDGTLIFHIEGEAGPLVIKGLAKGEKLQETYQQFLNLVSLLRFNPSVKGFIQ
ncbi:MAG TPA: tetratricopeptide repeat protein [Ktedonobacteraceae bacterium]|jgi:hypothetical protein|nr:tetratricopeptide repeat protein [Ktedonobacteraceae bacterium]